MAAPPKGGRPPAAVSRPLPPGGGPTLLFPCIFLEHGTLVVPVEGQDRGQVLRAPSGAPCDVFDAVDHLLATYHRVYVVDLEGVRYERPQFEYLQELTRGQEMWVDAGCRDADQAMDVLVAGATRAVLNTATLLNAREISRTLKLTSQVALAIEMREGTIMAHDPSLASARVEDLVRDARERGVEQIILSNGGAPVDWSLVEATSRGGPTFVYGSFFVRGSEVLSSSGARGGIFPAGEVLTEWMTSRS